MSEQPKSNKAADFTMTLLLLVFVALTIVNYINIENISENINTTNTTQVYCNQNLTEDIRQEIKQISIPACPACNCPAYAPTVCDSTVLTNTNMLMLDKFSFRYDIIKEEYNILKDELEDGDRAYCKDNVKKVSEDYSLAFSYIQEYYSKTNFKSDSREKLAYDILITGNEYYKDYIKDVEANCNNANDKIELATYKNYELYLDYYNQLRVNSTLPNIQILEEIDIE